ncbi:MAG: hypothetical protein F6J90_27855 [Moorea sp. SIOASIH]|uniref:hypothetical protein n=1 Tax=Moorena sp. SIOASIH TaxID=2607817 RepID=UPI0013BDAFDA|nr:hypothetical protein [Moorena sp. SIOASIH]NEO39943.1 hypothetical protein [Moorena sp. SIOASIH]
MLTKALAPLSVGVFLGTSVVPMVLKVLTEQGLILIHINYNTKYPCICDSTRKGTFICFYLCYKERLLRSVKDSFLLPVPRFPFLLAEYLQRLRTLYPFSSGASQCLDAKRQWGKPRQCGHGGNPHDRTASPVPKLHRF